LLRVVIGLGLLSNGTNLFILASGGLGAGGAPIIHSAHAQSVDPLPQALILTAIVIGFGVTALLLTLSFRTYQAYRSDDLGDLHGRLDDE
jgi:multicomponent Na+:H+ antiporter subunit C